jgi:nucleotide-binding universal stress UspA family protein
MNALKSLLVAEDLGNEPGREKRSHAVRHCAAMLAQKLRTTIDLVYVENIYSFYPKGPSPFKGLVDAYLKEQKIKLARIAKTLKVSVRTILLDGEPDKEILNLVGKKNKHELIILGTHGRTGWSRIMLGSVAEEIIRRAHIPVMTIGPNAQKMASKFLKNSSIKILVPTSLTLNTWRAEVYGVELARRLNAEVIFFHNMQEALEPLMKIAFARPYSVPAIRDYIEETKTALLKELAKKVEKAKKIGVNASGVLDHKTVSASESILKQVSQSQSSIIVMGTHGRSLATGLFFGRTAREIILMSPVPVVTVHSKKK